MVLKHGLFHSTKVLLHMYMLVHRELYRCITYVFLDLLLRYILLPSSECFTYVCYCSVGSPRESRAISHLKDKLRVDYADICSLCCIYWWSIFKSRFLTLFNFALKRIKLKFWNNQQIDAELMLYFDVMYGIWVI